MSNKELQLKMILELNPMTDDYHVGIRKIEDIKTFAEAIEDDESFVYGDYYKDDAINDLKLGKIKVYSSKPIENGNFVSTSFKMALDYAGGKKEKVNSKVVALDEVAWINGDEGIYANIKDIKK